MTSGRSSSTDLGHGRTRPRPVIRAGYELLNLHTYFTAGVKEVRAWTVKSRCDRTPERRVSFTPISKRVLFALRSFRYDDFIANNGSKVPKMPDAGVWKARITSVQDGDVIHFRFNV